MKSWDELGGREREQIGLMLVSLKEFSYAFRRTDEVAAYSTDDGHPVHVEADAVSA